MIWLGFLALGIFEGLLWKSQIRQLRHRIAFLEEGRKADQATIRWMGTRLSEEREACFYCGWGPLLPMSHKSFDESCPHVARLPKLEIDG